MEHPAFTAQIKGQHQVHGFSLCSLIYLGLALSFLSVLATAVPAQTQKQKPSEDETTIRISTEIVLLDVQVLRKRTGVVVSSLNKDDFDVYEDGVKQEISFFGKDKLPLSIMLLIDTSGSVRPVIEIIRDGAMEALRRLKPDDEVAVMVFGEQTKLIQPFTKDRLQIVSQLGSLLSSTQVGVGTSLHTALRDAARTMETASNPLSRRVIVSVTDNIATAYRWGDVAEQDVTDSIYDSGSVVCGVVVKTQGPKSLNIFDRVDKNDPYRRRINLERFVDETGGEVQFVPVIEVNQKLTELIEHLRTRYSLGYTSTNPNLDGKFRRVRVTVSKPAQKGEGEMQVRTRQGYYGRERKQP
ncbi:MAG: VWA domain-containing protein [Acidobacteria bacterium]|nr:VWA domain-containing protein [Acidobacteriota bacterium]MBI3426388.1 VWA domain-containing protein [Acidobacteriota bacterium]